MCLEKRSKPNSGCTKLQFEFVERFSELMNIFQMYQALRLFHKNYSYHLVYQWDYTCFYKLVFFNMNNLHVISNLSIFLNKEMN